MPQANLEQRGKPATEQRHGQGTQEHNGDQEQRRTLQAVSDRRTCRFMLQRIYGLPAIACLTRSEAQVALSFVWEVAMKARLTRLAYALAARAAALGAGRNWG